MTTFSFVINEPDEVPKIKTILKALGAQNLKISEVETPKSIILPKQIIEMIDKGIDEVKDGKLTNSEDVHKQARELCIK